MRRIMYLNAMFLFLAILGIQLQADEKRFDLVVREDIFAGFNGDKEAMARGVKACDDAIAKDPKNAEALVWRGAGRVFQASDAFRAKNQAEGLKLWLSGLKDMDEAVALEPKNVGVRIPRAAVLLPAARFVSADQSKRLLETVRGDFEAIYAIQKDQFNKLGTHPQGELRMGLAEVYRRLNQPEKSKEQLDTIVKELPNSKYAGRAKEWLAAKADVKLSHNCIGCHTAK
jgi:hypothetical protein